MWEKVIVGIRDFSCLGELGRKKRMPAFVIWSQNLAPMWSPALQTSTFSLKGEALISTSTFMDGLSLWKVTSLPVFSFHSIDFYRDYSDLESYVPCEVQEPHRIIFAREGQGFSTCHCGSKQLVMYNTGLKGKVLRLWLWPQRKGCRFKNKAALFGCFLSSCFLPHSVPTSVAVSHVNRLKKTQEFTWTLFCSQNQSV